jgi:hypothetical protein
MRWCCGGSRSQSPALLQVKAQSDTVVGGETFSYAMVRALDEQRPIFSGVAGYGGSGFRFRVGAPGSTSRVPGGVVTGSFYDTLGLKPVIGRLLTRDDDQPARRAVAVASYGYWERQFARDPRLADQAVLVNGVPVRIVGVSPRGFVGANVGAIADLTITVAALPVVMPEMAPILGPGNYWLRVLAPDPTGVSTAGAQHNSRRCGRTWRKGSSPRTGRGQEEGSRSTPSCCCSRRHGLDLSARHLRAAAPVLMTVVARGAAHRVRERGELAAGPRLGPSEGDRGAPGDRRRPRPHRPPAAGRERAPRARGRGVRHPPRIVERRFLLDALSTGPLAIELDLTPNWHVLLFTAGVAMATALIFGLAPSFRPRPRGRPPR